MKIIFWIKRTLYAFLLFLVGMQLVTVCLLVLLIEREPMVSDERPGTVSDAVRIKHLGESLYKAYFYSEKATPLKLYQDDMNATFAMVQRSSSNRLAASANISSKRATFKISLRLVGSYYLNLYLSTLPSNEGILFEEVAVGPVKLYGHQFTILIEHLLDLVIGKQAGRELLQAVHQIKLDERVVTATIRRIDKLDTSRLAWIQDLFDSMQLFGDESVDLEAVREYYQYLAEISEKIGQAEHHSLSLYLQPLFAHTMVRSKTNEARSENLAALLALGIYFGDGRLAKLIGPVPELGDLTHSDGTDSVVLAGRRDLRLHFVISASLQLLSDSGTSFAIGELKELMDAGEGGSGFSFVDLAADRAGIEFAILATEPATASGFQRLLADSNDESLYFPDIEDLREGLTEQQFVERYMNTESQNYRDMLVEVDRRIGDTPLFIELDRQRARFRDVYQRQ